MLYEDEQRRDACQQVLEAAQAGLNPLLLAAGELQREWLRTGRRPSSRAPASPCAGVGVGTMSMVRMLIGVLL